MVDTSAEAAAAGASPGDKRTNLSTDDDGTSNKRPRVSGGDSSSKTAKEKLAHDEDPTGTSLPHLTADVWALVMPFLPYGDNLQCCAVSRSFLKDVIPRVKKIAVMFSYEMKVKPARRFLGVEEITIACLLTSTDNQSIRDVNGIYSAYLFRDFKFTLDSAVVRLSVPFISSFPSLKGVFFGFWTPNLDYHVEYTPHDESFHWFGCDEIEEEELDNGGVEDIVFLQSLLLSICGAYESGAISLDAWIHGCRPSFCPEVTEERRCRWCSSYVQCYPLGDICSSGRNCLPAKDVFHMISKRHGGREYLESKEFIFLGFNSLAFARKFTAGIAKEIGVSPAKISREELDQWLNKNPWHAPETEAEAERLAALGVPVKFSGTT